MAIVLVVDDHPVHRDLVATLLGYCGQVVLEACDGAQALLTEERHKEYLRVLSGKLAAKIRELQAAQESLQGSEVRFRPLAESSPIGIFSLDSHAGSPTGIPG